MWSKFQCNGAIKIVYYCTRSESEWLHGKYKVCEQAKGERSKLYELCKVSSSSSCIVRYFRFVMLWKAVIINLRIKIRIFYSLFGRITYYLCPLSSIFSYPPPFSVTPPFLIFPLVKEHSRIECSKTPKLIYCRGLTPSNEYSNTFSIYWLFQKTELKRRTHSNDNN